MINRTHAFLLSLVTVAGVSACGTSPKQDTTNTAKALALKEELTTRDEAVVWLYDNQGNTSTHWIRHDAAGIEILASRNELVIPTKEALWRLVRGENDDDVDVVHLVDLISGKTMRLPLDENAVENTDEAPQTEGSPDAGPEAAAAEPLPEDDQCRDYTIQADPVVRATVGPFFFLTFDERRYNCDDELLITTNAFAVFDLENGEAASILSEEELLEILASEDLSDLERVGEVSLDGITPFYSPSFDLSLTYTFSARSTFVSDDGEPQSLVSSLEIAAAKSPKSLAAYVDAPELVRTFGVMIPSALPGGWWRPDGPPESILKQMAAFAPKDTSMEQIADEPR